MREFKPRKFSFKAWNRETKLMMRLNSIECRRGELIKKDHILLQFTGMYDSQEEEIYEMDILMIGNNKFLVMWDDEHTGWITVSFPARANPQPLNTRFALESRRLWSSFEADKQGTIS